MPIAMNILLLSATSTALINSVAAGNVEKSSFPRECKVECLLKEKIHSQVTGKKERKRFVIHYLPDNLEQATLKVESSDENNCPCHNNFTFCHQRQHYTTYFLSNTTSSKTWQEVLRRKIMEFFREEYNRTRDHQFQPDVIIVVAAINTFLDIVLNKEDKEDNKCSICLQQFEEDAQGLIKTPCSHIFHGECMMHWFRAKSTCPNCRHEFALSLFIR
ncbi:hypothetical protein ACFE04_027965 [Oxalis oulophora]